MKWFKPKYTVCAQCKVHFEPYSPQNNIFSFGAMSEHHWEFHDYCPAHRQSKLEQHKRYQDVVAWASKNWERLEDQMRKEDKEEKERWHSYQKACQNSSYSSLGPQNGYGGFGPQNR